MHSFTWNGKNSLEDFGIMIEKDPDENRPARRFSVADVAGRNGNLYDIQDAFEEVERKYNIFCSLGNKDIDIEPASIASFDIMRSAALDDLVITLPDATQDLNGYDHPWAGGNGENVLPYPFKETTLTRNGITFTDLGDGRIKVNGTATSDASFEIRELRNTPISAGVYTLTGCPTGGGSDKYSIWWMVSSTNIIDEGQTIDSGRDTGEGLTFVLNGSYYYELQISIESGQTLNNVIFEPMIRKVGTNLLPFPYYETTKTVNGITFTVNAGGKITANGTATGWTIFWMVSRDESQFTLAAGDYIISNGDDAGSNETYQVSVSAAIDGANVVIGRSYLNGGRFTVPANATSIGVYIGVRGGTALNNLVFRPRLQKVSEIDDDPIPWEPYENICPISGTDTVKISQTGKNLLPYPYQNTKLTNNGVTYTVNADGTVTANGTATANSSILLIRTATGGIVYPSGQYIVSGCPSGGGTSTYTVNVGRVSGTSWAETIVRDTGNGGTFTFPDGYGIALSCNVQSGQTVNNLVFKPMLRLASETDSTWESPVNNETISVSLRYQGSVVGYGGTLNVTTGQLTIDRRYVEYDGSSDEAWVKYNDYGFRIALGTGNNGVSYSDKNICNRMTQADSAHNPLSATGISGQFSIGGYFSINLTDISSITDVASLRTWLASNPLQVVYELANPATIQLDPTEIKTFIGRNNIFAANAGDIAVKIDSVPQDRLLTDIMEWLYEPTDYAVLSDTYDPNHYREAVLVDAVTVADLWQTYGRAEVTFRCRPERFIVNSDVTVDVDNPVEVGYTLTGAVIELMETGERIPIGSEVLFKVLGKTEPDPIYSMYTVLTDDGLFGDIDERYVVVDDGFIVENPTKRTAKPRFTFSVRAGQSAELRVNDLKMSISTEASLRKLICDCETENVYIVDALGNVSTYNQNITITDLDGNVTGRFMSFKPNNNYIVIDDNITALSTTFIDARFWEL